jgi:DNA-binding NarL/FixJ family response regulator
VAIRISLVLIDDNPSACEGVVALIRAEPGFQVLAASAEIEEALRQVRQNRPDLVLLNLQRVGDDSLKVAGALHGESPESRVIVMGMEPFHEDVAGFVRAGVSGFIMADASSDAFLATIRSIAAGNRVLPSELTGSLFGQLNGHGVRGHPEKRRCDQKALTSRERAVTALIVQGLSNKAIAARLLIALHTVKSHVHKVLSKLAVNSRLEVAAFTRRRSDPSP